ncbi:mediator of RNA polymerase II transcription subunit 4 [Paragonimus westermani]|uniref:Mediator of RNA polymerase II transcription subunit 4 n=1 Tax=Paragonimus westermani TaxID=34504 RepID=A0A5J4NHM4_9TREM|nr:mediator of RNA polymerase II transcription subunit 4 [Paragonimus westermani]
MSTRVSTKQKLLAHLEGADSVLRDIVSILSKRTQPLNLEPLVQLLLEKDRQFKSTLAEGKFFCLNNPFSTVETQTELQSKIDLLRSDCLKSDRQIHACQLQLKKSEILLSTALYYSRQKLDAMAKAVKNPVDIDELVRFSHRISATHGVSAPDNWVQGDPRRPYPNREEIRRGYLGHLDDNGHFRPSFWDALSETAAAAAAAAANIANSSTPSAAPNTTAVTNVVCTTTSSSSHGAIPSVPGVNVIPHNMDSLTLSGSPNMILPGVNMVSSPLTLPQTTPGTWSNTNLPSGTELSGVQGGAPRPSATSLAAMLEPHTRSGLVPPLPPPLRVASTNVLPQPPVSAAPSSGRVGPMTQKVSTAAGHRSSFTSSPAASSISQHGSQVFYSDVTSGSGHSPKTNLIQQKRNKRKVDAPETLSSASSSDLSSVDE